MNNIFDRYYQKYDAWYDRHRFAYLSELEAIKRILPKKGKGLEIGVGTGRFAAPLGIKYGIDPSKQMSEIARRRGVDVKLGHSEKLPFGNCAFDYAAIIITLCFVKDPIKALTEARRVLKKNGKIIIGIIDKQSFLGKFYRRRKSVFYKQAIFFSVPELVDLLKTIGFNRISYYQTIYKFPDKIDSVQEPREGFGKGAFVVIRAYKSREIKKSIYRKFRQYERIRFLFKRYGYDMEEARKRVLKRAGRISEPVLDVGTGPGRMAYTLANAGFRVTSIDISKESQEVAKIYAGRFNVSGRIEFMNMDAQSLKFQDGSFSTVISANLLHDVREPKRVVEEMMRVTKPKGTIVVSDLNKKGKALVNRVYRIDREIHRGKPIDLEKMVAETFRKAAVQFKKFDDGYITTYVSIKNTRTRIG